MLNSTESTLSKIISQCLSRVTRQ